MRRKIITAITAVAVSVCAVSAQNVTVKAAGASASKVFADLMRQTGKNFVYSPEVLKGVRVTVSAYDEPLEKVLSKMFAGTGVRFRIKGDNVLLSRVRPEKKETAVRSYAVSGFIRESVSGEPVPGAVVRDVRTGRGVAANASGFYSLTMPAGKAELQATCFDFVASDTVSVNVDRTLTVDFALDRSRELQDVVVIGSRLKSLALESHEVGATSLTSSVIAATPVLFGESDVTKTLQLEPGVSAGFEGLAGMLVHGGEDDENLYMLDNIPLYQVNHFAGLFSAFNTEAMRSVDFYKSSFPAKYDGRLSSYMDVHTKDGSLESHHGSFRLGLTSGSVNVDGPIWKGHTSYSVALRRSWYDVLTIPAVAIINKVNQDDDMRFRYDFTDLNVKINHNFSPRSSAYVMAYYGEDYLKVGNRTKDYPSESRWLEDNVTKLHWGNVVASAGWKYVVSPKMYMELSGAFSRYFSRLGNDLADNIYAGDELFLHSRESMKSKNSIDDWMLRADFDWRPGATHHVSMGAYATFHSFLPSTCRREVQNNSVVSVLEQDVSRMHAFEMNAYIGDDWDISPSLRVSGGVHASMFRMDGEPLGGISPRLSARFSPSADWAVKASYARTMQYVHQLSRSYISLPTDQWIPVMDGMRPQSGDKVAAGVYRSFGGGMYVASLEGYWRWMHNIIDYRDEYYLLPPETPSSGLLTAGKGSAKGIDFKLAKTGGKVYGHIAYSLMWADRCFRDINGGEKFPARGDNRHKVNVSLSWKISDKWEVNAAWTGMSGNRMTLPTQVWGGDMENGVTSEEIPLVSKINNYRLPFYHRLDLGAVRRTSNGGFWTFSLFNAYCNMNVVTVVRSYDEKTNKNKWKALRMIPMIPSVSYTWVF